VAAALARGATATLMAASQGRSGMHARSRGSGCQTTRLRVSGSLPACSRCCAAAHSVEEGGHRATISAPGARLAVALVGRKAATSTTMVVRWGTNVLADACVAPGRQHAGEKGGLAGGGGEGGGSGAREKGRRAWSRWHQQLGQSRSGGADE
jgi:hypothetical protein